MYLMLPRVWQVLIKATISVGWALIGFGGIAAAFVPPNAYVLGWGPVFPSIGGTILTVAAILAILGLVLNRYRWEWVASWVAGGCLAPYIFTIWWLVGEGHSESLVSAIFSTALLVCVFSRSVQCAAHAARLRVEYTETDARLHAVEEAVEEATDGAD